MKFFQGIPKVVNFVALATLILQLQNRAVFASENYISQLLPEVIVGSQPVRWSNHRLSSSVEELRQAEANSQSTIDQLIEELILVISPGSDKVCSESFAHKVRSALKTCPRNVLCLLRNKGCKIVLAPTVCDYYKTTIDDHPRGYFEGATYRNVPSMFSKPDIIIGESYTHNGHRVTHTNIANSVFHEIGHAVDHFLHGVSSSVEFLSLYDRDESDTSSKIKAYIDDYYCQDGNAGPSEAFAQLTAQLLLPADVHKNRLSVGFPYCFEFVEELYKSSIAKNKTNQIDDLFLQPEDGRFPNRLAAIKMNSEGLQLLDAQNWAAAKEKFREAMSTDFSYNQARKNLAVAHSNAGLKYVVEGRLLDALTELHQAAFLDFNNREISYQLSGLIGTLGKKWDQEEVRCKLGLEAEKHGDLRGAFVEYIECLRLNNDLPTRNRLRRLYKHLSIDDKEIANLSMFDFKKNQLKAQ